MPPSELWNSIDSQSSADIDTNFDETVQHEYASHQTSPPGNLWQEIGSQISGSSIGPLGGIISKTGLITWVAITSIVAAVSVLVYKTNQKKNDVPKNPIALQLETVDDTKSIEPFETKSSDNDTPTTSSSTEETNDASLQTERLETMQTPQNQQPETHNPPAIQPSAPNANAISDVTEPLIGAEPVTNSKASLTSTDTTREESQETKSNEPTNEQKPDNTKEILESDVAQTDRDAETPESVEIVSNNPTEDTSKSTTPDEALSSETVPSESKVDRSKDKKSKQSPISKPKNRTQKFQFSAYVSPSAINKHVKKEYTTQTDSYSSFQPNTMRYNFGLQFDYEVFKNFAVGIGAQYVNVNQEFYVKDQNYFNMPLQVDAVNHQITVQSVWGEQVFQQDKKYAYFPRGATIRDTLKYFRYTMLESYKMRFLSVPISLNYRIGNEKLKLIVTGGISPTWTLQDSSVLVLASETKSANDIRMQLIDYHTVKDFSFGYTIAAGVQYNVTRHISLILTPTYNTFISNLNLNQDQEWKPSSFTIATGLAFRF